jgi:exosortase
MPSLEASRQRARSAIDSKLSIAWARNLLAAHWQPILLGALVAALYAPVLDRLVLQWWSDPDYGHGFLVPLFVGYVVWRTRGHWQELRPEPSQLGLLVMLAAIGLLIVGLLGAELFVSRVSLVVLLAGMALYLAGWRTLRALAFPLAYLLLMIPLPAIIYNQVTFPLQLVASRMAAACLELLRVPVLREGNLLLLPNYTLEVVEACSGIRSLMSLVALAVAYGYLVESRYWVRGALLALMFPIAVWSNSLRVVGAGTLTYVLGPEWAEGFFHVFSGWLIFLTALAAMLLTHWLLNRVARPAKSQGKA